MKAAMSSSSVLPLPELPSCSCPDRSLLDVLPRPELVALSPALLPCDVKRFLLAKLLLYLCIGAGRGEADPEDAMACSPLEPGARKDCCGSAVMERRLGTDEPKVDGRGADEEGDASPLGDEAYEPALKGGFLSRSELSIRACRRAVMTFLVLDG